MPGGPAWLCWNSRHLEEKSLRWMNLYVLAAVRVCLSVVQVVYLLHLSRSPVLKAQFTENETSVSLIKPYSFLQQTTKKEKRLFTLDQSSVIKAVQTVCELYSWFSEAVCIVLLLLCSVFFTSRNLFWCFNRILHSALQLTFNNVMTHEWNEKEQHTIINIITSLTTAHNTHTNKIELVDLLNACEL